MTLEALLYAKINLMFKIKLTTKYRELLAEKLMDLGNLIITGLVIGQFISGIEISVPLMLGGFFSGIFCYIISFLITKK